MELIPSKEEYHLLVGLKEEKVVSLRRLWKKGFSEKTVEEVAEGVRRANPPLCSTMSSRWTMMPQGQRAVRRLRRNQLRTFWEILAVCRNYGEDRQSRGKGERSRGESWPIGGAMLSYSYLH